jgi:DNA repair protein SbcD/Mre11
MHKKEWVMFRFVHTADIHLDSPLKSLAIKETDAALLVENATRQSFIRTIDLCIEEQVDALIIAGDVYDGELRSMKTAEFFTSEMRRLVNASIQVFMVKGNHDAESKVTRTLQLPDGVHVFSTRGDSVILEEKGIALHGVSFSNQKIPDSLLPSYPPPKAGYRNIGILHTSLAGSSLHDTYAPCSLQDLYDMGYDYWALGHIHKRAAYEEAACKVVMPGNPQGRHINESGKKSVTYVTIPDEGEIIIEERISSIVQFERLAIDISAANTWQEFSSLCKQALRQAKQTAETPYIIVRVTLCGTSPMAAMLRRDGERTLAQLRDNAAEVGSILIEQCDYDCHVPMIETKSVSIDPVVELHKLMTQPEFHDDAIMTELRNQLQQLQAKLPHELRDNFSSDNTGLIQGYIMTGAKDIMAHLEVSEREE